LREHSSHGNTTMNNHREAARQGAGMGRKLSQTSGENRPEPEKHDGAEDDLQGQGEGQPTVIRGPNFLEK